MSNSSSPVVLSYAAVITCLLSAPVWATPVLSEGQLVPGGSGFGAVSSSGSFDTPDSALSDYWTLDIEAGLTYSIGALRLESDLDPVMWLFDGIITDTDVFAGGLSANAFDALDPGFIGFGDDELLASGPFGDPLITFTSATSGTVTAIVTNFASGPDDGGDGFFDYTIVVVDPVIATPPSPVPSPTLAPVPIPASFPLLLAGAGGLVALRRWRSKRG